MSYGFTNLKEMKRILELRANPSSKSNGIVKYCEELREMFMGDTEITIFPIRDFPMKRGRFLKERFTDSSFDKEIKNADIVHINGYAAFIIFQAILSAVKHKKKIVYTAHWHPFQYLSHPRRGKVFFNVMVRPLVKRFVDVVITLNNEDTAFFSKFHNNVVRIPHWSTLHHQMNSKIEKDPNMILFVGRLFDDNKGLDHLFHLPEGKYKIHIVGAGEKKLRSDMIHHINISTEELEMLYSKASLLVVPSRYEAFSYVALEALLHNTPVLLSDRVRIADYLEGTSGVSVFQYRDYKDFTVKVASCLGSNVDSNKVERIFSEDRIRKMYSKVFKKL